VIDTIWQVFAVEVKSNKFGIAKFNILAIDAISNIIMASASLILRISGSSRSVALNDEYEPIFSNIPVC